MALPGCLLSPMKTHVSWRDRRVPQPRKKGGLLRLPAASLSREKSVTRKYILLQEGRRPHRTLNFRCPRVPSHSEPLGADSNFPKVKHES